MLLLHFKLKDEYFLTEGHKTYISGNLDSGCGKFNQM